MNAPAVRARTVLTIDEFAERIGQDTRTIRRTLCRGNGLIPERHVATVTGDHPTLYFFYWDNICRDAGLPNGNYKAGDLLTIEQLAKYTGQSQMFIIQDWLRSMKDGVHYVKLPGKTHITLFIRDAIDRDFPDAIRPAPATNPSTSVPPPRTLRSKPDAVDPSALAFSEVAARWMSKQIVLHSRTSRAHLSEVLNALLLPRLGAYLMTDISEADIESALFEIRTLYGTKIITPCISALASVFDEAGVDIRINGTPLRNHKLPTTTKGLLKVFSVPECIRLIEASPVAIKAYVAFRMFTALRDGEVHALRWRHVSPDLTSISVEEVFGSGSFRSLALLAGRRTIPLSKIAREALRHHRAKVKQPEPDALVFAQPDGSVLTPEWVADHGWRDALQACSMDFVPISILRNTGGYLWLCAGHSIEDVSQWFGYRTSTDQLMARFSTVAPVFSEPFAIDRLVASQFVPGSPGLLRVLSS